jgi:hypothetical protein
MHMIEVTEARSAAGRTGLEEWWAVPRSTRVVGFRVPIHAAGEDEAGCTGAIDLPEELVGKVLAWSASVAVRRGGDRVPIESLGSQLGSIEVDPSGRRTQRLLVRWRTDPGSAGTETEREGLVCSLLLALR